jgi:tetratricopeptide (TPR) repeat protein
VESILRAAARYGASGDYAAAFALLESLPARGDQAAAGMLRARMLSQQGRYDEAIAQCKSVLAAHPNHGEALRCLAAAERMKRRPFFMGRIRLYLGVAALVVLLLAAAALAGFLRSRPDPLAGAVSNLAAQQRASEERTLLAVGEVARRLQAMQAAQQASRDASQAEANRLRRQINTLRRSLDKLRQESVSK